MIKIFQLVFYVLRCTQNFPLADSSSTSCTTFPCPPPSGMVCKLPTLVILESVPKRLTIPSPMKNAINPCFFVILGKMLCKKMRETRAKMRGKPRIFRNSLLKDFFGTKKNRAYRTSAEMHRNSRIFRNSQLKEFYGTKKNWNRAYRTSGKRNPCLKTSLGWGAMRLCIKLASRIWNWRKSPSIFLRERNVNQSLR